MSYQGDLKVGQVLYFHFTTRQFSSGAPITSASLALSVYKDDNTTQSTSGVTTTFTTGFDSVVGLVSAKIDTSSDGTFYAAGHDFSVVVTAGTSDSVSIVGEVVGSFSIENRSALRPTTAGRTLDVSAGGEAGLDWANVGSPTTSLALTGTTIAVTQKVDVDTIKTNPVVNGGTITFPTTATLASTTNITAGTIATVTTVTNQLTAAAIATGVWQDATAGDFTTASSIGKALYIANVVPGAAGGHFIAGTNAATTITTGLTTHIIGTVDTVTTVTNQLTAAQIATGIWQDTTAGDFTTALSIGKSIMNGVSLGTGLTVNALTTNNDKTGYSLSQTFPSNFSSLAISAGGLASADVKSVNAHAVTGDGHTGTEWGPA